MLYLRDVLIYCYLIGHYAIALTPISIALTPAEPHAAAVAAQARSALSRAEARRLLQWFDRKFDYEVGGFLLHEKMETESRYVFIGRVQWLCARDGLVDAATWRVRLQDYHPVGRFGASFYVRTRDRFSIDGDTPAARRTAIDEI